MNPPIRKVFISLVKTKPPYIKYFALKLSFSQTNYYPFTEFKTKIRIMKAVSKSMKDIDRTILAEMLEGDFAHASFEQAVKNIPIKFTGVKPEGIPYTIWQLCEHIRITQWDIMEFSFNEDHLSPIWPKDYWPSENAPINKKAWEECLKKIHSDRIRFIKEIKNPEQDLYLPFLHGNGQTLFREAILLIDHTSYHTGQIVLIRKLLGIW